MKRNKKPLYIFLHIPKCAGTTVANKIEENLSVKEFIRFYKQQPFYNLKEKKIDFYVKKKNSNAKNKEITNLIVNYIKSLSQRQRNKIKILYGHSIFYGVHNLFPNREPRYITFLRDPSKRTVSCYNFLLSNYKYFVEEGKCLPKQIMIKKSVERNYPPVILNEDKTTKTFYQWLRDSYNKPIERMIMKKTMKSYLIEKKFIRSKKASSIQINKYLDRFYFIGDTDNPSDHLILKELLGLEKEAGDKNISIKYFDLKNANKKTKNLIESKNKEDTELLNIAIQKNKEFKKRYSKKEPNPNKFLNLIYKISGIIKRKSRVYNYILKNIKEPAPMSYREHVDLMNEDEI